VRVFLKFIAVLRIRDPVPFWPLYPVSGMNIPDHISESLETIFWIRNIPKFFDAVADPGSGILLALDPESILTLDPVSF
jgi:hypothetical protein